MKSFWAFIFWSFLEVLLLEFPEQKATTTSLLNVLTLVAKINAATAVAQVANAVALTLAANIVITCKSCDRLKVLTWKIIS